MVIVRDVIVMWHVMNINIHTGMYDYVQMG